MPVKFAASALFAAVMAMPAQGATAIADAYTRTSPAENITTLFTAPTGTSSVNRYTGPIEVLVTGTGFSAGSLINDAFYFVPSGNNPSSVYKLGIGTSAEPLVPLATNRTAARLISFINSVGAVSANTAPAYDISNRYNFVIELGSLSSLLSFGVIDDNFGDNGGQYNITIWQLAPSAAAVPESATWMMMIIGFGAIGVTARRRQKGSATA